MNDGFGVFFLRLAKVLGWMEYIHEIIVTKKCIHRSLTGSNNMLDSCRWLT